VVDLTTTNVLLGILAAVAVVQLTGLIVGGVMAWRAYQRSLDRLEALEQQVQAAVAPLAARVNTVMDRVERITERVDSGAEKLDHALAVTSHGAHIAMNVVNGNVQRTAAIAAALASGGRAALRAWRARGEADREVPLREVASAETRAASVEAPSASSSSYINHHRTEESHVSI
jgi:uncharacterized protein YoxC